MTQTLTQQTLPNALSHYYPQVAAALRTVGQAGASNDGFDPGYELPPFDDRMRDFLSPSVISLRELGEYGDQRLRLLDLMGNPRTRTTKTFASLLIVARAVRHIQETGERILILTPSSGNKATALRDAVLRAIESGLVTSDQIQIVTVVPAESRHKLWTCDLDRDRALAARNPVAVYGGSESAEVKQLAQEFVTAHGRRLADQGVRVWYTLALTNYQAADAVRAFFEEDFLPPQPGTERVHAHSVSSAFGLLGHHLGTELSGGPEAGYFLVQHLGTPDMVLHLHHNRVDDADRPTYELDQATGLYRQDSDPTFPSTTFDPLEKLDTTFYTHRPVTADDMSGIIARQGGGGIVVSLHECLQRYAEVRVLLGTAGIELPADPRQLREWSLVMALTGVVNAIDRGLLKQPEVIVHGSGYYTSGDFEPLAPHRLSPVATPADLAQVVEAAVEARP
ncbi:DUF6002 family protein [Micromonospora sp. NPDC000316]|uniref:DUF6002 family protein n=1 Tax=Micromonospora sp. NPDC000316 TaxID=3364216 RepID=UPI0036B540F6